jgi:hypothetical protein
VWAKSYAAANRYSQEPRSGYTRTPSLYLPLLLQDVYTLSLLLLCGADRDGLRVFCRIFSGDMQRNSVLKISLFSCLVNLFLTLLPGGITSLKEKPLQGCSYYFSKACLPPPGPSHSLTTSHSEAALAMYQHKTCMLVLAPAFLHLEHFSHSPPSVQMLLPHCEDLTLRIPPPWSSV